jgi:hypothetical protein
MLGRRVIQPFIALLLSLTPAGVRAEVSQPTLVAAEAYVRSAGFASVDIASIAARIPGLGLNMTPPEIAALLLEFRETKNVWRMRTVVRLERRMVRGDVIDMVDIERFNLGPAIRGAMIHDTGKAPEAEAFGVGPHVAWRIVTRPDSRLGAVVIAAGRRDYPDFEARERDCAGLLCTSVAVLIDQHGDWTHLRDLTAAPSPSSYPAVVTHSDGQIDIDDESLAHALRELAVLGGLASTGNGVQWIGPPDDQPALMMVDNEASDGEDGIVCPQASAKRPQCFRRTVIVNPGPTLTVGVFKGALKKN